MKTPTLTVLMVLATAVSMCARSTPPRVAPCPEAELVDRVPQGMANSLEQRALERAYTECHK